MKIILLAGGGRSSKYIYNALSSSFKIDKVLIPENVSKINLVKRRIKRLGILKVLGQLVFQIFIVKIISFLGMKRFKQKEKELGLISFDIPEEKILLLGKLNSNDTINIIKHINPDLIIVNGTSIISSKILECTNAKFINTHVGITPEYRGVHGGYWALRNGDKDNFGVTVHIVDSGIDTGSIIYQEHTNVESGDNFIIYPLYQYALAIPLLKKAINDIKFNKLKTFKKENVKSKLYYHPTFFEYISGLLFKGVS